MATSVEPGLVDAMVALAAAALPATTKVSDGPDVSNEPGDFLMVGVDDPDAGTTMFVSAVTSQKPGPFGLNRPRDEFGEIICAAQSWNGDGNAKTARDAVYAITAALENLCRTNPSLGVPGVLWTGYGSASQLRQGQTPAGARADLIFRISFRARL